METLKPRDEVLLADVRNQNRVDLDLSTGFAKETTIDTFYEELEPVTLNVSVPVAVRNHFEIARNLILYSWFVYSFNVVAAMQAYASLEMAARIKTSDETTSFKNLLDTLFKGYHFVSNFGPPIPLAKRLSYLPKRPRPR